MKQTSSVNAIQSSYKPQQQLNTAHTNTLTMTRSKQNNLNATNNINDHFNTCSK